MIRMALSITLSDTLCYYVRGVAYAKRMCVCVCACICGFVVYVRVCVCMCVCAYKCRAMCFQTPNLPCGAAQEIVAGAGGKGVILASMGTLCNFGTDEFRQIARALSSVPYTVIWKVAAGDLPGNASVESLGLGANVKVCF
jgi:hypothetical protein